LPHLHAWQDQYMITGSVGLVVFVFALFTLRELSPNLRDQLMVSVRDRKLLEMKVKDIDIGKILEKPWKQMMKLNILVPATSIALFLLIYYAAVGFFVIYFVSVFGFSEAQGNDISNWFWAADAVCVVSVGIISDRFKVRKPFMLIGGIGAIVMTIIFATRATHPSTSYGELVLIAAFLSGFRGVAYSPWMTAFSETIEARNPALVATGLAIWGWILRAVVSISFLILPYVLTSVTPLVTYGPTVKSILALYPAQVATARAIDPATLAALKSNQKDFSAIEKAVKEIAAAQNISSNKALGNLIALRSVPKSDLSYLEAYGVQVETAQKSAPRQWQTWWWVCVAGEVIFVPSIFLLTGRWSPKKARLDAEDHQAKIDAELAKRIWGMQKEEADLALS
ncbi:MAG: MFS transporter, partial [Acidimicrobiales bacterium]|nr:MFS transporter [Acidimicrobiales bacterium]